MRMRAAVMAEQGRRPPFRDSRPLAVEEIDLDGPGPGEVLVCIAAAGLCHSDLSALTGERPRRVPTVPGHEAAGVVEAVGAGVTEVAAGDHVVMVFVASCGACGFCAAGRPNLCESSWRARSEGTLGTGARRLHRGDEPLHHYSGISAFAEYAVVTPASLVRIDPSVPLDVAAIFGCAVITGVGAVVNTARVGPGATTAIVGLGGVGLSALLGAAASGAARIAAIDLSPAKRELATALGATETFDAGAADCAEQVLDAFGGRGVEFAFDLAGAAPAAALAYRITARGGTMVTAGLPNPKATIEIPLSALVSDERVVRGSYMGSAVPRRDIPRFVELYRTGRLPIDRLRSGTVGLDGLNDGFDRLAAGQAVRDVMVPGATP